jgi:hypothetical protein
MSAHNPLDTSLNCESALAILSFLERNFEVNQAISKAIRDLCG